MTPLPRSLALTFVVLTFSSDLFAVPPLASPPLAKDLVHSLSGASMDAFAAADSTQPGRFVALLSVPGQLLVVSAMHPSAAAIEQRIAAGLYRDVYLDLQGTPTPNGKIFVQDADANGLADAAPNSGTVDVVYENGSQTTMFDGNHSGQKLTARDYDARLEKADAAYAHALSILKTAFEARSASDH